MPKFPHEYGDQPIEPKYMEMMKALAQGLDEVLNGSVKGALRQTGFILLVYPFGEKEGRCNYISNGADREDVIKLLREQAAKFEADIIKRKGKQP